MKGLLRSFLVSLGAIYLTSQIIPGLEFNGGFKTYVLGALTFMLINLTIVPLLKILFLPLNLLTFGFFTWVINVIALFILTKSMPNISLVPYSFPGLELGVITLPALQLSVFYVAVISSFLIGLIINLFKWIIH